MKELKYFRILLYIGLVAILSGLLFSCINENDGAKNESVNTVIYDSISVIPINEDSLTIITPGENGIPFPEKLPAGHPETVPAHTNIFSVPELKKVPAGSPVVITPGFDTFPAPEPITVNLDSVPVIRAGIPEVVLAKDPHIRDQNPGNFSSFSKMQGLKHDVIRSMIQDREGNIWFATDGGVSKYDGKFFTHFTGDEGLSDNSVMSILEDRRGNLWFGTFSGVSKYDGKSFIHFTEKEGLSDDIILSILEDRNGNFWFGTYGDGVFKYDGMSFTQFTEKDGLLGYSVMSILEDREGNLWFGSMEGGASKYDGKSFKHYTGEDGLPGYSIRSIIEDREGNLWFGTHGAGVAKYDGKFFTNYTEKEGLSSNRVISILEDRAGNLWFGTLGEGISKYDGKTFTHFAGDEGLPNSIVWSVLEDRNGNLWFGTDGGVSKYGGHSFTHFTEKEGLSDNSIWSIYEDRAGNLWVGSFGGVSKYDGESFTHFTEEEGLSNNSVWSIHEDREGNFWFGTDGGGVSKYDGQFFTHFTGQEGLSHNSVMSILEDREGNFWFGTFGGGVSKYDGRSFTHYSEKEGMSNNVVWSIFEDHKGNIWFGTERGVNKYDGKSFTHYSENEGLSNNSVRSILEDRAGNLWIGTAGGGVSKYDGKSFTHFTEREGLSNNYVFGMLLDKDDNLWFGTRFGLSKLVASKRARLIDLLNKAKDSGNVKDHRLPGNEVFFKTYSYEDGFLGIGVNGGNTGKNVYQASDGTIWIAANNRLTAYSPESYVPDTIPPNVQFTGIELFGENIQWVNMISNDETAKDTSFVLANGIQIGNFRFDSLARWNNLPVNLSLAYNNNNLTFNFIGITQYQPRKVQYQYMLLGMDENWSAITSRTYASYGNLPHGTYTFKLKAMNSEGYWSDESTYTFEIRSPWWKTWWFRTIYITAIILTLISIYLWRTTNLRKRQKELEKRIHEATTVINKKNTELEQLNADKDKFFGIIAHDLKNPFNSLLTLGDLLVENALKYTPEKTKELAEYIQVAANQGYKLLENLLEWARLQTGSIKPNPVKVKPSELVHEVIFLCEQMSKAKSIDLQSEISCDNFVLADQKMIKTVLRNLVTNALKFTNPKGSVKIKTDAIDNKVLFTISDTGLGIEPEHLDKLFRIESKPSKEGTSGETGTGLGLILCKEFVEKNNGKIWVESELGKGSDFKFTLPLCKD